MQVPAKPLSYLSLAFIGFAAVSPAWVWAAGSSSGVVSAIEKKYLVTETSADREQVTKDGTTMVMKCAGVYSTPSSIIVIPDNQVEDGKIKSMNFFLKSMYEKSGAHVLQTNDKVYITKIESKSDPKGDALKFTVLTVEDIDAGGSQKKFDAFITFRFKKGYLDDTPPDEVEQAIEAIMAPDSGNDEAKDGGKSGGGQPQAQQQNQTQQQTAVAPPPPPPPAANKPPPEIKVGETSTKVLQELGMPQQMIDLDKKKIFVYKDLKMKIVFVDDKVTDVQ
jgi:hypothetical protein